MKINYLIVKFSTNPLKNSIRLLNTEYYKIGLKMTNWGIELWHHGALVFGIQGWAWLGLYSKLYQRQNSKHFKCASNRKYIIV